MGAFYIGVQTASPFIYERGGEGHLKAFTLNGHASPNVAKMWPKIYILPPWLFWHFSKA